jgi:hypothetical protein
MRLPFTKTVDVVGSIVCREFLLKVPANFIILTIEPPVMLLVSS